MELIVTIMIAIVIKLITENPQKSTRWKREKKTNNRRKVTGILETTEWQNKAKTNIQKAAARAKQRGQTISRQVFEKTGYQTTNSSDSCINYEMPKRMVHTTPVREQLQGSNRFYLQGKESQLVVNQQIQKQEMKYKNGCILEPAKENVAEDIKSDDILLSITDLMVKGYDGKLCFERDFLGEAMDMISHFQPPTELPNYNISEMKF